MYGTVKYVAIWNTTLTYVLSRAKVKTARWREELKWEKKCMREDTALWALWLETAMRIVSINSCRRCQHTQIYKWYNTIDVVIEASDNIRRADIFSFFFLHFHLHICFVFFSFILFFLLLLYEFRTHRICLSRWMILFPLPSHHVTALFRCFGFFYRFSSNCAIKNKKIIAKYSRSTWQTQIQHNVFFF